MQSLVCESPSPCNAGGFTQLRVIGTVPLGNQLQAPCKSSWAGASGLPRDARVGCRALTQDQKEPHMAGFCAVPTPNPCECLPQQPASLACLVKPPGPSHMSFCMIYPGKSEQRTLLGMGPRGTPRGWLWLVVLFRLLRDATIPLMTCIREDA